MSVEVVWVPVTFKGAKFKAPFVMFAGWTMEQRKAYEADLRKVRAFAGDTGNAYSSLKGLIFVMAHMEYTISAESASVALRCLDFIKGHYARTPEGEVVELGSEFDLLWLDMQIGMVKVPEL